MCRRVVCCTISWIRSCWYLPFNSWENKWPNSSFHWQVEPQKLWEVIWVGFQDTDRNKKSIRQSETRGRENVIDWDEDLGCLAVLNLSLPPVPQTLCPRSHPHSHPLFIWTSFLPSPLFSPLCSPLTNPTTFFHFLPSLYISKGPHKLLFLLCSHSPASFFPL